MKRIIFVLITFFAISSVIISCNKDDDSSTPSNYPGAKIKTTVTGRIIDTNGHGLSYVSVFMGGLSTISDERGFFLFEKVEVSKSRIALKTMKEGFFDCIYAKKTQMGEVNYVNLVMEALPAPVYISGTSGGVVNINGGASITFPVNAFVDAAGNPYTGQVKILARHIFPGNTNFESLIPGGDLSGTNSDGVTKSLYSFGMIEAKLYDDGGTQEIKIADGKTAELKFPIDPAQNSAALSTIPMWHLNESTAMWEEDGEATKSGNFYIGSVSHFSMWNCDYSGERCDIQGKVVDCLNNPIPNAIVTINGFLNVTTDNLGLFTTWVPAGFIIECQLLAIYNPFLINSNLQTITAVSGQLNIIPTLIVPCATRIEGRILDCNTSLPTAANVYIDQNGLVKMIYTTDGTYSLLAEQNTTLNVIAAIGISTGAAVITTGNQGSILIAPDIELCDIVIPSVNTFTINSIFTGNTTYNLQPTSTNFTTIDSSGITHAQITVNGVSSPGDVQCTVSIHLKLTSSNGIFSLSPGQGNQVSISFFGNPDFGSGFSTNTTSNSLVVSHFGMPGGYITGNYEFDTPDGTITMGSFSVLRNN